MDKCLLNKRINLSLTIRTVINSMCLLVVEAKMDSQLYKSITSSLHSSLLKTALKIIQKLLMKDLRLQVTTLIISGLQGKLLLFLANKSKYIISLRDLILQEEHLQVIIIEMHLLTLLQQVTSIAILIIRIELTSLHKTQLTL